MLTPSTVISIPSSQKRRTSKAPYIYIWVGHRAEQSGEAITLRHTQLLISGGPAAGPGEICSNWALSVGSVLMSHPARMSITWRKLGRSCLADFSHTRGFFCLCSSSWHLSRVSLMLSPCKALRNQLELLFPCALPLPPFREAIVSLSGMEMMHKT